MSEAAAKSRSSARRAEPGVSGHVVPIWLHFAVYAALLVLTASTTAAAFVDMGPVNNVVALAIAASKAALVGLVFMHLRWSTRLLPLVAVAGLLWLSLLIAGSFADYLTRGLLGIPGK